MAKELLAPAGDLEAGYAALYYGADAVYLGLKQFSARATAQNFSEEELGEFVGYAHHLGRKVFVTINTVLQQNEMEDLLENLDICRRCRVDALIIQDLGVARVVKQYYPEFELHASTQMAVHNKAGALALKNMGFARVVLARELTLAEIKEIATIPSLELEVFVHGALCYSYSGICQFSSMTEGRSANRGKCLYPCRAAFERDGKSGHYFSMKDMALEEDVLKLPVYSLKIEGRKKNALYVAAVTDYYRGILDGKGADQRKAQNIKQIFSRPWCKFHLRGRSKDVTDTRFVGHRGLFIGKIEKVSGAEIILELKHDIARHDGIQIEIEGLEKPFGFSLQKLKVEGRSVWQAKAGDKVEIVLPVMATGVKKGAAVYLASSSAVKGAYDYTKPRPRAFLQRLPIDVEVDIGADTIVARTGGKKAEIRGVFGTAKDVKKTEDAVRLAFGKTGDTLFELRQLTIKNPAERFVPVSMLNNLRRQLLEQIAPEQTKVQLEDVAPRPLSAAKKWIVKADRIGILAGLDKDAVQEMILLLRPDMKMEDICRLPREKLRLALPAVCRQTEEFASLIDGLLAAGYKKWEVANYWGLDVLPVKKLDVSFDNLIYMFNTQAMQAAKELGLSRVTLAVEDTLGNLKYLAQCAPLPVVMVVYQDVPLFTSAVCIRDNDCRHCDRYSVWTELFRNGRKYLALSENCGTMLFADKPFAAAKEAAEVRADFYRADFCYRSYTLREVKNILQQLKNFENPSNSFAGNMARRRETF